MKLIVKLIGWIKAPKPIMKGCKHNIKLNMKPFLKAGQFVKVKKT